MYMNILEGGAYHCQNDRNFGKQLMLYDDSVIMRGSRKYFQRGSNSNNVFIYILFILVDEGREDPNSA